MPDLLVLAPLAGVLAATDPSTAGTSPAEPAFDPNLVSPGLVGFLATFAVVLVCVLLFRDLTKRIRRLQFRGDQEAARLAAEGGPSAAPGRPPGSPSSGARPVGLAKGGPARPGARGPAAPAARPDDPLGVRSTPPARADETDGFRENPDTRD